MPKIMKMKTKGQIYIAKSASCVGEDSQLMKLGRDYEERKGALCREEKTHPFEEMHSINGTEQTNCLNKNLKREQN